jgi:hypothetical protein
VLDLQFFGNYNFVLMTEIYQETVKKNMLDNEPTSGKEPQPIQTIRHLVLIVFFLFSKETAALPEHSEKVKLEAPSQNPQPQNCRC